jgi:hypothetical protein
VETEQKNNTKTNTLTQEQIDNICASMFEKTIRSYMGMPYTVCTILPPNTAHFLVSPDIAREMEKLREKDAQFKYHSFITPEPNRYYSMVLA